MATTFLLEFICPKCGRSILWTLPSAEVRCKHCKIWVSKKDLCSNPASIKINVPEYIPYEEPKQLAMF